MQLKASKIIPLLFAAISAIKYTSACPAGTPASLRGVVNTISPQHCTPLSVNKYPVRPAPVKREPELYSATSFWRLPLGRNPLDGDKAAGKRGMPPLTPGQKAGILKMEQAMTPTPAEKATACASYLNNLITYVHSGINCAGQPGWGPVPARRSRMTAWEAKNIEQGRVKERKVMTPWEAREALEHDELVPGSRGEKRRVEITFNA